MCFPVSIVSVNDLLSDKKHVSLFKQVNLAREGNIFAQGYAGKDQTVSQQIPSHLETSRCGCLA